MTTGRPLWILWTLAILLSALALALTAPAALSARDRVRREIKALDTAKAQAAEIAALRSRAPRWAERPPPEAGLTTSVADAVAAAGLPPAALASLSPENETDAGGGGSTGLHARRRRAVLTLSGVTLPQVGGFLAAWREREGRAWTVARVDLSPDPQHRPPAGGGDLPLRATIGLEALYVDPSGSSTERGRR